MKISFILRTQACFEQKTLDDFSVLLALNGPTRWLVRELCVQKDSQDRQVCLKIIPADLGL